ncbi:MAG: hypothetical protein N2067_08540 [Spirochaetaceae bacterium]|nr:hypothetical protein [Spirochaetaceae bacterium]
MTTRSIIARALLVAALVLLAVAMYFIGKGHTLYLDTHAVTFEGTKHPAPLQVTVQVDNLKPEDLIDNDRVAVSVMGQRHRLTIDQGDGSAPITRQFSIPLAMKEAVVSVTAALAGLSDSELIKSPEAAVEEDFGSAGQFFMMQDTPSDSSSSTEK